FPRPARFCSMQDGRPRVGVRGGGVGRTSAMGRENRSDPGYGSGPQRYPGSFLLAFREAVAALDWKVVRWLGGAVECSDAGGREHVVGLENLYRRARREERASWPELIATFLQ